MNVAGKSRGWNTESGKKMAAVVGGLLCVLVVQRIGCGSGVENGGIKPPKQLSRQEMEQDVNTRVQAVQNNPNMPPQAKDMIISMIRRQADSTAAAQGHK